MRPVHACTGTCNRGPAAAEHGPGRQDAWRASIRGGLLRWLLSLGHARESDSLAKASESLCHFKTIIRDIICNFLVFVNKRIENHINAPNNL